jgi:hypothetical protein
MKNSVLPTPEPRPNSKYLRWYDAIIERARARTLHVYLEKHHILPRSLCGGDEPGNLVDLTYREHFLVHWLLTKFTNGFARTKMLYALHCMTMQSNGGRVVSGWRVDLAKRLLKQEALRRLRQRRLQQRIRRAFIPQRAVEIERSLTDSRPDPTTLSRVTTDWLAAKRPQKHWRKIRRGRRAQSA